MTTYYASDPTEVRVSVSAVVRRRDEPNRILLMQRSDNQHWGLPGGYVEPGESVQCAAQREVREETGLDAEVVEQLGDVRYSYVRGGQRVQKVVTFFLFRYLSGNVEDHDHEVEEALWIPLAEAPERLSYKGEREMAVAALSRTEEGR